MDEVLSPDGNYGEIIRRRTPIGLSVGIFLLVVAIGLALGLPSLYRSRAVVLIEAQEIPQDLVRSLVTSYADQRMQIISQRVLTNSNLAAIIQKFDLYAEERRNDTLEAVLVEMREDISMLPISADVVDPKQGKAVKATIAFELAYENESPEMAQRVTNEIVSLFLNENLKQRSETSEDTLGFLSAEADKLRTTVASLEEKLAEFKQNNPGRLPELSALNLELMNRTETQLTQLESQLQSLQQQKVYLESELSLQKPTSDVLLSETGQRILGPTDRLKVLESEFVPLASRYGSNHPDVVAKRKEIEALRTSSGINYSTSELSSKLQLKQSEHATLRERYSESHPDVLRLAREIASLESEIAKHKASSTPAPPRTAPDNPAYIQLSARLEAANAEISSLQVQRMALRKKLDDLEARITEAPEVEREYRMLSRDYDIAQAKYQEVLAKRQEAELASSLESNQRGERFTLIEPPIIPEEPAQPNRVAIGIIGSLLSILGGIGSGALAEALDTRIYGRRGVTKALGIPPLAVIPMLDTLQSTSRRRSKRLIIGVLGVVVAIALLLLVHIFFSPLDVLFYRSLRFFS